MTEPTPGPPIIKGTGNVERLPPSEAENTMADAGGGLACRSAKSIKEEMLTSHHPEKRATSECEDFEGGIHFWHVHHEPTEPELLDMIHEAWLQRRIERATELAHAWNVLRVAAEAAEADDEFSDDEEDQVREIRDAAKAAFKEYIQRLASEASVEPSRQP